MSYVHCFSLLSRCAIHDITTLLCFLIFKKYQKVLFVMVSFHNQLNLLFSWRQYIMAETHSGTDLPFHDQEVKRREREEGEKFHSSLSSKVCPPSTWKVSTGLCLLKLPFSLNTTMNWRWILQILSFLVVVVLFLLICFVFLRQNFSV